MTGERWYEFTQREVFDRPYFVKAATAAEARAKVRSGDHAGDVSGYPNNGPDDFKILGRGKLAESEYVEGLSGESGLVW